MGQPPAGRPFGPGRGPWSTCPTPPGSRAGHRRRVQPPSSESFAFAWCPLLEKSSFRWCVGIWRAGRDRRMLLQTLFKLRHDLHGWGRNPRVPGCRLGIFLLLVRDEVENLRRGELGGRGPPVALLVVEDHLPIL